jgi:hypothetical protein
VTSFSLDDLTARLAKDRGAVASFLYYMGLLTLTDTPRRLRIPNLDAAVDLMRASPRPGIRSSATAKGS